MRFGGPLTSGIAGRNCIIFLLFPLLLLIFFLLLLFQAHTRARKTMEWAGGGKQRKTRFGEKERNGAKTGENLEADIRKETPKDEWVYEKTQGASEGEIHDGFSEMQFYASLNLRKFGFRQSVCPSIIPSVGPDNRVWIDNCYLGWWRLDLCVNVLIYV